MQCGLFEQSGLYEEVVFTHRFGCITDVKILNNYIKKYAFITFRHYDVIHVESGDVMYDGYLPRTSAIWSGVCPIVLIIKASWAISMGTGPALPPIKSATWFLSIPVKKEETKNVKHYIISTASFFFHKHFKSVCLYEVDPLIFC